MLPSWLVLPLTVIFSPVFKSSGDLWIHLLDRKLIFDFQKPFDFVPKYTEKCERSPAEGGASEQPNCPQNPQCLDWSQLLNEVRTFFEQNTE